MFYLILLLHSDEGKVEDLMSDIEEQRELQEQISNAIGQPGMNLLDDV